MAIHDRIMIYKKIEEHRHRPLLVYATSKRQGVDSAMASDAIPYLIDAIDLIPQEPNSVDFLIVSLGGDPMVAYRIISLLRERVAQVFASYPKRLLTRRRFSPWGERNRDAS